MESGMPSRPPAEPLLLNRELSLLKFNERVLAMAENPKTPLLERCGPIRLQDDLVPGYPS